MAWIGDLFRLTAPRLDHLEVVVGERIVGPDGTYDLDATVRFGFAGMDFLVLVEAKRHYHPIKRELVQVLHDKVRLGAHKGVMFSTARYQRGALDYAVAHGIALVSLTEGRFTFETRAATPVPVLSREEASRRFDLPTFAGHCYGPGGTPGSISLTLMSTEHPEYVQRSLLGVGEN